MSPVASSQVLAGTILLLVLGDPTDACSCAPQHPQMAFCQADVVIRGKFVGVTPLSPNSTTEEFNSWIRYKIKITKTYKGLESSEDTLFIDSWEQENFCGYQHKAPLNGEEYLIMAERQVGRLIISICSFVRPWGRVPPSQRRGISQAYEGGCACRMVLCDSWTCQTLGEGQCLWIDELEHGDGQGPQAQHLACLPRPSQGVSHGADPFCAWQTL